MIDLIRPEVANLKPYVVENIPHKIKMDANENPYDLPEHIKASIAEEIYRHHFNRYPDPTADELRELLSSELNVDMRQIVIGNGSDELINYTISAFGGSGAGVIFPVPTFSIYGIFASLWGTKAIKIPLSNEFDISSDEFLCSMRKVDRGIVFISYPNNPTGNCFSRQAILDIIKSESAIVVIDEAYYEFSGRTFISMINDYDNLIILRTFSKAYGLAGLRVGYMITNSNIAREIMKVKMVYNINSLSQKIAMILLKHKSEMYAYIDTILKERKRLEEELGKIADIRIYPSDSNFILFRSEPDAEALFLRLIDNGILIRNLNEPGLLHNCLRVTVGKPEENDAFLSAVRKSH